MMNRLYLKFSLQLILLSLLSTPLTGATNYYVEITGSDEASNDGSIALPFRSIGHAIGKASNGDIINIGSGEFTEFINISKTVTLNGQNTYSALNPPLQRHNSQTLIRAYSTNLFGPLITVAATNVTIQNISIHGDAASNGVPSVGYGIYTTSRPVTVSNCKIANIFGSGIECRGTAPPPLPGDEDAMRSYLTYNLISNVSHSSNAVGIYLQGTQASVEHNEISGINGPGAYAGIYVGYCDYTTNMSQPVLIRSNYLNDCAQAIWANDPVAGGETIEITGNTITNSLIGIRLTAARGQALIDWNTIHVSGISATTNQTPARGIWIQADQDPWNPLYATDHLIFHNTLMSEAVTNDGTIGMLFSYDTTTWDDHNNGVRATVYTNYVYNFAVGSMIVSGTNGVSIQTNPLVEVEYHFNDIYESTYAAILTTGFTYMVDATTNFLGYYDPSNSVSTNVDYTGWTLGSLTLNTDGNDATLDYQDDDDDGDGIIDTDELPIGTSPTKADTDNDGMIDPDEYFTAGTDPLDPASVLSLKNFSWTSVSGASFDWPSVTGRTYYVYRTTNLVSGFGTAVTNFSFPTNSYTDPDATGMMYFYQISVTTNN